MQYHRFGRYVLISRTYLGSKDLGIHIKWTITLVRAVRDRHTWVRGIDADVPWQRYSTEESKGNGKKGEGERHASATWDFRLLRCFMSQRIIRRFCIDIESRGFDERMS